MPRFSANGDDVTPPSLTTSVRASSSAEIQRASLTRFASARRRIARDVMARQNASDASMETSSDTCRSTVCCDAPSRRASACAPCWTDRSGSPVAAHGVNDCDCFQPSATNIASPVSDIVVLRPRRKPNCDSPRRSLSTSNACVMRWYCTTSHSRQSSAVTDTGRQLLSCARSRLRFATGVVIAMRQCFGTMPWASERSKYGSATASDSSTSSLRCSARRPMKSAQRPFFISLTAARSSATLMRCHVLGSCFGSAAAASARSFATSTTCTSPLASVTTGLSCTAA